jgi:hypothetical protein
MSVVVSVVRSSPSTSIDDIVPGNPNPWRARAFRIEDG